MFPLQYKPGMKQQLNMTISTKGIKQSQVQSEERTQVTPTTKERFTFQDTHQLLQPQQETQTPWTLIDSQSKNKRNTITRDSAFSATNKDTESENVPPKAEHKLQD